MIATKTMLAHIDEQSSAGPILAVGDVQPSVLEWLEKHGATIIDAGAVTVIALPERAIVERVPAAGWWDYRVSLYNENDVEIAPGLFYELSEDARQSRIGFRRA